MSSETRELLELCEQLPQNRREEVADFARFLLDRERAGATQGDKAWERIIHDEAPRPKLERFLQESAAEGADPLDLERL